uniref:FRIGIDA-like protein n=1 Tax=Picea sitchensis TaxID=3332 RepID=B8LQQ6_PICSI|nr:unknown [Picea sitchensis]
MSVASSISAAMDAEASKKERLHKEFLELQLHSSALVNFTVQWKELEDHFNELEKLMQKRFEEFGRKGTENEKEKKSAAENSTGIPNKTSEKKSVAEKSTGNPNKTSPALKDDVKPRPQLKFLCEKMDGEGLKKFLADSRSDITEIPNEVPAALRCAPDPAKLVLQTLEGFYPAGNGGELCMGRGLQRYACNLLLESLPFVLSPDEVSSEAKKDAQKIAAAWKSKHSVNPEYPTNTQEAKAFLQLLASYGISKEFKDDDLCELVLCISPLPKAHEFCHALQITHTIPDIVEKLRSRRKYLDAIYYAYAFGLVEKITPIPLLKAYLEDEKKKSEELVQKGKDVGAQNTATSREIASLNTIIKFIELHKLESQMSIEDLQKRVGQLQRTMSERKRQAKAIKSSLTKRARLSSGAGVVAGAGVASGVGAVAGAGVASGVGAGVASGVGAVAVAGPLLPKPSPQSAFALSSTSAMLPKPTPPSTFAISNSSDLYRPAPDASIPSYNLPGQGVYDRGTQGIYRSAYDIGSNPSSLPRSHLYPSDSLQSSLYGVGSFRGSTNYGSYNSDSGVPPATSYQSSYLR